MLRIGDFSRLGKVTIQTLRHYDQIGLLKPVEVDHFTGYRFYSAAQLPQINRILLLKDLGFNLDQIKKVMDENLPVAQLVGMLKLKRAEVEQHINAEQARLDQIEARLRWIQEENSLSQYEIALKSLDPLPVLSIQDTVDAYRDVVYLWRELKAYMRSYNFGGSLPYLAIWQEFQESNILAEAAIPFEGSIPTNERVKFKKLPAVECMACTIHQGSYEEFGRAYEALIKWNETNGYRLDGPMREVYLHYEPGNSTANITEIQLQVIKI